MILIVDNYDSFVHNVARYFVELGERVRVVRNDAVKADDLKARAIVISPGPCTPHEAGQSMAIMRDYSGQLPILAHLPRASGDGRGLRRHGEARKADAR